MKTTIGRTVIYKTTEEDRVEMQSVSDSGQGCNTNEELPAIIVAVWSDDCINVRVIADGNLTLWRTSINEGEDEGNWHWPAIEK